MTDQAEGLREVIARAIYGWTENDWAAVAEQGGSTALEDAANVLTAVNEYVSAHLEDAIDAGLKVLDTMPDDPYRDFCIAFLAALGFSDGGEER